MHDKYLIASMKNGSVYVYFGDSGRLATVIEVSIVHCFQFDSLMGPSATEVVNYHCTEHQNESLCPHFEIQVILSIVINVQTQLG